MVLPNVEPQEQVATRLKARWLKRLVGRVYGAYTDYLNEPERYGGNLGAHIEAEWTTPEHWAHNNYQRGHLPQLCICASGWKARLLAAIFWPKPPYEPTPNIRI